MTESSRIDFFHSPFIGDFRRTNLDYPGLLGRRENATIIFSLGLRIMGLSRDEEDRLLDRFIVEPTVGDKPMGRYPGNVLSTLRYINEDRPDREDPKDEKGYKSVGGFLPGYILLKPWVIPVCQSFRVTVSLSTTLERSYDVRVLVFTLMTRDVR
jgi:hypothetical protein